MNQKKFIWIMIMILSIYLTIQISLLIYGKQEFDCGAYAMQFNRTAYPGELLNGIYHGGQEEYFCVWTKDRSPEDIAETTFHELAHYYVDNEEEHFINGWVCR